MRSLILGGAACVWDDAEAALSLFDPDVTIAINDMIGRWAGRIDAIATLHPEKIDAWTRERARRRFDCDYEIWAHKPAGGVHRVLSGFWRGSSGLFAVQVAREIGCDRIVLAGVPMQPEQAHFFDGKPWTDGRKYTAAWLQRQSEIAPFVRSVSGWTKELFGEPNKEWLAS